MPGGEIALLNARNVLEDDNSLGGKILSNALLAPFKKLVENAGYDAGEMMARLKNYNDITVGFDVNDGGFKPMLEAGIIDPKKVVSCAVRNSISVAIAIMTIGCSIVPIEEKDAKVS